MIIDCPKPVIARVNGWCIGGGNHLAYFCDITIAAEHARFGQNGPRVGSPAGGYMVSQLANIVGHKRAREMWLLCRRSSAQEMYEWGLVNSVVPLEQLDEEVGKWCQEMLSLSPTCLAGIKASFRHIMKGTMDRDMFQNLEQVKPDYFETGEQAEGAAPSWRSAPPTSANGAGAATEPVDLWPSTPSCDGRSSSGSIACCVTGWRHAPPRLTLRTPSPGTCGKLPPRLGCSVSAFPSNTTGWAAIW